MRSYTVVVLIACVSCMEMHETVERMVMVRTTGSDLQPAATGFIYKKETDGPASVVKMGESEIMEHLSKMYEQPKSFAAPIPVAAGPFFNKIDEGKTVEISSESKIIPVVENQEDKVDHIDGIADEDDRKLEEYASDFGNYKSDLDKYIKSLQRFDDINLGEKDYSGGSGVNSHDNIGYSKDYVGDQKVNEASNHDGIITDQDKFKELYADEYDFHKYQPIYDQDKAIYGFYKYFDSDEYAKDQDYPYGETGKLYHEIPEGHGDTKSKADKFDERGSYGSAFIDRDDRKGDSYDKQPPQENSAEHADEKGDKISQQYHNEFSFESGKRDGRSYGYAIKH